MVATFAAGMFRTMEYIADMWILLFILILSRLTYAYPSRRFSCLGLLTDLRYRVTFSIKPIVQREIALYSSLLPMDFFLILQFQQMELLQIYSGKWKCRNRL